MLWKSLICSENGPNYQLDDARVAARCLLAGADRGLESDAGQKMLDYLNLPLGSNRLFFTDSGRTGLTLALRALGLEPGSEVLIQAFSCVVVPGSVLQAGLIPVVADIHPENLNLSVQTIRQLLTPRTKAVVVQYNFGLVPDMGDILEFCRELGLYLIEDMAHALGAKVVLDGQTKMAGTLGDAAVFSLGRDKVLSTTSGGAVWINPHNQVILNNFEHQYEQLEIMPQKRVVQNLLYALLFPTLIRPLYHLQLGKLVLQLGKKLGWFAPVYTPAEKRGRAEFQGFRFSPRLYPLLLNQLGKLDRFNRHRRQIARIYADGLLQQYDPDAVYLRYPLNLDKIRNKPDLKTVVDRLKPMGFVLGANWYNGIFLPKEAVLKLFNYQAGSCPVSERLIQNRVLNLPTNIWVSERQARQMVNIILSQPTNS